MMVGVMTNGMMIGARLDCMKIGSKPFYNSASSLSLGSFDLGAMSSPKRFELAKMDLDTGAALTGEHEVLCSVGEVA